MTNCRDALDWYERRRGADMGITDELRTEALGFGDYIYTSEKAHRLLAIADRIDAEHDEAITSVMNEALYHANDESMAELGWVRLPKDADGEYIRIGDEMRGYGWPNGGVYCQAIVNEVTILVGPQDGAYRGWLMWATNECRHHHAPTVEDVLTEVLYKAHIYDKREMELLQDLIAEYAAKLRLAGDGE